MCRAASRSDVPGRLHCRNTSALICPAARSAPPRLPSCAFPTLVIQGRRHGRARLLALRPQPGERVLCQLGVGSFPVFFVEIVVLGPRKGAIRPCLLLSGVVRRRSGAGGEEAAQVAVSSAVRWRRGSRRNFLLRRSTPHQALTGSGMARIFTFRLERDPLVWSPPGG
jgi:hypothetical protein